MEPSKLSGPRVVSPVFWRRLGLWLPVTFVMALAVIIRWRTNFSGLMPGVNGTYYPVQVRSLLRDGRLGFPDFPLVFWLEALVARLLFALKMGTLSDCIMWASKGVDAIFPTLAAVPAFLLARAWVSKEDRPSWTVLVVAAFTVLYLSALIMTADFQKNAAGTVWLLFFIYYLYQALQRGTWKTYTMAGAFFVLAGLTHIGCFGMAIAFLLVLAAVSLLIRRPRRRTVLLGVVVLTLLLAATAGGLYLFFDPTRVERLFGAFLKPLSLFENPVIFTILKGQPIFAGPPDIINLAVANILAILGAILLVRRWKAVDSASRPIVIGAILTALFSASPFLGYEWAERLSLMAYTPAAIVLAFLFANLRSRLATTVLASVTLIFTIASALMMFGFDRPPSISEAAYRELHQIRSVISQPERTIVLARHGLEWWAAWVLETDTGQEFGLDEEAWNKYAEVLYLEQIAGTRGFGPGGPGAPPFPEVRVPSDAEILFEGQYFRLAKAISFHERRWPDFNDMR